MVQKLKEEELRVDLSSVSELLILAEEANDKIAIRQYSKRKEYIENELNSIISFPEKHASVALFFGGDPVFGSRGILAEFAGNIIDRFQSLISIKYAVEQLGSLGERGIIPKQKSSQLMITSVAKGSFGFILDENLSQMELQNTEIKEVVDEVAFILQSIASSNRNSFESAVELFDSRFLTGLRNFFITLKESNATIRLVEDNIDFTLDRQSILRAYERVNRTDIKESDEIFTGELQGLLPDHKKFEFKVEGAEDLVLYGSLSKEALEQYKSYQKLGKDFLHTICKIKVNQRKIEPLNGRSRQVYKLLGFINETN